MGWRAGGERKGEEMEGQVKGMGARGVLPPSNEIGCLDLTVEEGKKGKGQREELGLGRSFLFPFYALQIVLGSRTVCELTRRTKK